MIHFSKKIEFDPKTSKKEYGKENILFFIEFSI